jgi:aspartokinase/homoserine dehydrogenase 1
MAPNTLVMKFGGTSVGTVDAMRQAVEIIHSAHQNWPRLVAVTSALSGVTDLLLDSARKAACGDTRRLTQAAAQLLSLHDPIAEALVTDVSQQRAVKDEIGKLVDEFTSLCHAINVLGESTPRALDAVASLGERLSVRLLAASVAAQGIPSQAIDATRLIVTDNRFTDAHPDLEATTRLTRRELEPVLGQGQVAVVTGFIAATPEGVTTTLGRGGSDYSAALLGAALPADEVWIWTDVDGVMTADPRLVPQARSISELSYREVSELAYFGAKVLHPKTIRPVIEAGIGLRICNTFNPSHPGTRIVSDALAKGNGKIKAVTTIHKQRLITLEGRGMLGVPGMAARTFAAVAATHTSVPLITQASSEQSICFAVPADACPQVLAALESTFVVELGRQDLDSVWATEDVEIVTVVGAGMRSTPGIAGRVFSALGDHQVNVIAIAQGSSEVSISLVVSSGEAAEAVKALHQLILEKG